MLVELPAAFANGAKTVDGTAVQAAVRGGPAEAGRGGISGYHTGGRHANGAVRTHRTVQRPF